MNELLALAGGIITVLFGFVLTSFNRRISKLETCKQDKTSCEIMHDQIKSSFNRGDTKFDQIDQKLDTISNTLIRLETQLQALLEK